MTFASLSVPFLVASLLVFAASQVRGRAWTRELRSVAAAFAVMAVLTAVFDNIMIAADLFGYGEGSLLGVHVGRAPIEDFGYTLSAILVVAGVWRLAGRRDDGH